MIDLNLVESRANNPIAIITNSNAPIDGFYKLLSDCGYKVLLKSNSGITIFEFSTNSKIINNTLRKDLYAYIDSIIKETCGVN
jgi:hypothetical protein